MWNVVFVTPGAEDVSLLVRLAKRDDVRLRGVVDPVGDAPGTALAEAMGLPIWRDFPAGEVPDGTLVAASPAAASRLNGTAGAFRILTPRELDERISSPPQAGVHRPAAHPDDLAQLEDALDRVGVLHRLLEIGMAAAGAEGGSLLLRDSGSDHLYVAAAVGLDPAVTRRVRIRPGEGIAGRVSMTRHPERTDGELGTANARGALASSLTIPLLDGDQLLGVLNANAAPGSPALTTAGERALQALAPRLSGVVRAAEALRRDRVWRVRHSLGRELRELASGDLPLETALAGWAASLALALGAAHAGVALLRDDGSLLLSEGASTGETRTSEVSQHAPPWNDVLEQGRPVLVHERDHGRQSAGRTLHYLPIGSPVHAVLSLAFADAASDHAFQDLSDGVVQFLDQRLPWLSAGCRRNDELSRLGELAQVLSRQDSVVDDTELAHVLQRLTGAGRIERIAPDAVLGELGPDGWLLVDEDPDDREGRRVTRLRLADSSPSGRGGWSLLDKHRVHSLDSDLFTPFDAALARRAVLALGAASAAVDEAKPTSAAPAAVLDQVLSREMHRADRYHVAFSLSIYRPKYRASLPRDLAGAVQRRLRLSDLALDAPDGSLLVFAPEEPHAVTQLEHRVVEILRELAGNSQLEISRGHAVYPGDCETPAQLLATAAASLEIRNNPS